MNKILLGVLLGAVLGVFDGLTALFTPDPAIRAGIVGIIVGSTGKGLLAGLLCGLFARKVKSMAGGIALGLFLDSSLPSLLLLACITTMPGSLSREPSWA